MQNNFPQIEPSWLNALKNEFSKDYFLKLKAFLEEDKSRYKLFPAENQIFEAFNLTPFDDVKVVILGQDPYHGAGQAHGLSFSVPDGIKPPPSLVNIFKELKTDIGMEMPTTGNLTPWAKQGILLLNATLTVRESQAGSHQKKGWELFTDAVIKTLSDQKTGLIFLLWGNYAKQKGELINTEKHYVLVSPHPSPLARGGFFGCKHFSKTNQILEKEGKKPIKWQL
ncbi:MAG: uracil-DNA glycosylase [Bacteroidia bacterium]